MVLMKWIADEHQKRIETSSGAIFERVSTFEWNQVQGSILSSALLEELFTSVLEQEACERLQYLTQSLNCTVDEIVDRMNYAMEKQGIEVDAELTFVISINGQSDVSLDYTPKLLSLPDVEAWTSGCTSPYWQFTVMRAAANKKFMRNYRFKP